MSSLIRHFDLSFHAFSVSLKGVLLALALVSTTAFLIQFLGLFASDGAEGVDPLQDNMNSHIEGFDSIVKYISLQSLLSFGMGFGWLGFGLLQRDGTSPLQALLLAFAFGLGMLIFSVSLFSNISKLNATPKTDIVEVGDIVEAYTNIPTLHEGTGRIKVTKNGRMRFLKAATMESSGIEAFQMAKVETVLDSGIIIVKRR